MEALRIANAAFNLLRPHLEAAGMAMSDGYRFELESISSAGAIIRVSPESATSNLKAVVTADWCEFDQPSKRVDIVSFSETDGSFVMEIGFYDYPNGPEVGALDLRNFKIAGQGFDR